MNSTKMVTTGGLLICLAVLFQIIPVIFSELLVLATMLSALPIYIISRISPRTGIIAFFAAALLILLINTHEGLFFLCTNGPLGLTLGITNHYTRKWTAIAGLSSIILTLTLCVMNYVIGIQVFGTKLPGLIFFQLGIMYCFSFIYCIIYLYISNFLFMMLNKFIC